LGTAPCRDQATSRRFILFDPFLSCN